MANKRAAERRKRKQREAKLKEDNDEKMEMITAGRKIWQEKKEELAR